MGLAGSCVTSSVASWWRSGPEAWTTPGAKGDGTDRTATGPSRTITATSLHTESFDVTALVQGCPASGACVLAQYADAHVSVYPGAVLDVACGAATVCGDGAIVGSEGCDDGNTTAGDGCGANCAVEAGWTCEGAPSACATTCGDGIAAGGEDCDDGNNVSQDGCSAECSAEVCVWQ
jgi:cysteine-rich repeat protein